MSPSTSSSEEKLISLRDDLPVIPERLLLAHAEGKVLFVAGAGVSVPAGLPLFKKLTLDIYKKLDIRLYDVISKKVEEWDLSSLNDSQKAEAERYKKSEFDVALGMLERRIVDTKANRKNSLRELVSEHLKSAGSKHARIHSALMSLSDRGEAIAIATTNFDLLLQSAAKQKKYKLPTYALGAIPRPSKGYNFNGIFHIHGALSSKGEPFSELILTDEDFGEFYMRRRTVPDFIYDASRLFNIVFVGYSADDPPMKYLLNAIAADRKRFDDHKELFTFVGINPSPYSDKTMLEDWKKRGITPISFNNGNDYVELLNLLERWSELSAHNSKQKKIDSEIKRIVKSKRNIASQADRDLFDHLLRRSDPDERRRLSEIANSAGASLDWMDAIFDIIKERKIWS